jgi:hypothetical protein
MRVSVNQSGNQIEVAGFGEPVLFEVAGLELKDLQDHTFAAWLLLPWAMQTGEAIEVDGPVDSLAIKNIMRFSKAWELWEPKKFHTVKVVASSEPLPTEKTEDFVFYSGGLDSTDMLLQLGKQARPTTALTVQGFDYSPSADSSFAKLREQMAPLLEELNYNQVMLRISRKSGGYHSWGLQLASAGFLFADHFRKGLFSADYNWEQDMAVFPRGSNHITNRYFKGDNFQISGLCEDRTRAMKAQTVARHPIAIKSVSFCKRKEFRPKNCGTCKKCLRTKAMFAALGEKPDIFVDGSYDPSFLKSIDLNNKIERAFFVDLCQMAQEGGTLDQIPEMKAMLKRLKRPPSKSSVAVQKIMKRMKKAKSFRT